MTAWEMYWILRLDTIIHFQAAGILCSFIALVVTPGLADKTFGLRGFKWQIWAICWTVVLIVFAVGATLTPSTDDLKKIYGIEQTQTGGEK